MITDDSGSVLARLEQVERRCRRWRRAAFAGLLGSVLIVVGGAGFVGVPSVVEAERFVVRDSKGEARVDLGYNAIDDRNELIFFDPGRKKRLSLNVRERGEAWVEFFDSNGSSRMSVGVAADRSSGFKILDEKGRIRLAAVANPDGSGSYSIDGVDGKRQATLFSGTDGSAGLVICDKAGKERGRLTVNADGKPLLQLRDASDQVFLQSSQ